MKFSKEDVKRFKSVIKLAKDGPEIPYYEKSLPEIPAIRSTTTSRRVIASFKRTGTFTLETLMRKLPTHIPYSHVYIKSFADRIDVLVAESTTNKAYFTRMLSYFKAVRNYRAGLEAWTKLDKNKHFFKWVTNVEESLSDVEWALRNLTESKYRKYYKELMPMEFFQSISHWERLAVAFAALTGRKIPECFVNYVCENDDDDGISYEVSALSHSLSFREETIKSEFLEEE